MDDSKLTGAWDTTEGYKVNGVTVITSMGALVGDIQATPGSISATELATTLDLSTKSVTLATGEVSAGELAATLDLSSKTLTYPAGQLTTNGMTGLADGKFIIGTNGTPAGNQSVLMSGDATMTNGGVVTAKSELKTDLVTLGLIGTVAEFTFPFNTEVRTEQATGFCKAYDEGTTAFVPVATSSSSGEYTANYQLFPDTETENDAVYFGMATPFGAIYTNVSATVATYGADSVAWEYWDGAAWSALTILWDQTDSTAKNGLRPFQADGHTIWSAPNDWAETTVDSQAAYWVRARIVAGFNVTQIPLLDSHLHYTISAPLASEMPAGGTIGRGRISFITNSGANNNTNIILCNLTKGTASAVTALTKALQVNEVANFAVKCDKDDQIAIYVTQEDGTTEFANGILELNVVKT